MPRKAAPREGNILRFKATLKHSGPKIWRRFDIPDTCLLGELHVVLQIIMGWEDCHMHEFEIGKRRIGAPGPGFFGEDEEVINENNLSLADLGLRTKQKFVYTYDFGDGWEHEVQLEKILAPEPGAKYPVCIEGEMACPPEDCGGIGGYYNLLEALADSKNEEHEELLEWIGGRFDPKAFSLVGVNKALNSLRRPRK